MHVTTNLVRDATVNKMMNVIMDVETNVRLCRRPNALTNEIKNVTVYDDFRLKISITFHWETLAGSRSACGFLSTGMS